MRAASLFLLAFGTFSLAQQKSAVFGIVRDSQSKQPIAGVTLILEPYALRPPDPLFPTLKVVMDAPLGFETTTDAAGRYRFPDLPPHRYCLRWQKQGYSPSFDQCDLTMVRTTAGRDVQRDISADLAASIHGRFIDNSTNAPIRGLRLSAVRETYVQGARQWITYGVVSADMRLGEFEITRLPPGPVYLEILPEENEKFALAAAAPRGTSFYGRRYYPDVADIKQASPIVLAPGENRLLEIRLSGRQPKNLTVEITAPGAAPDAKIDLTLKRRSLSFFPTTVAKATVKPTDSIRIEGIDEGDYTLVAWGNDGAGGRSCAWQRFSTADPDFRQIRLILKPSVKLRGSVRVESKSGEAPNDTAYLYLNSDERDHPEDGAQVAAIKIEAGGAFETAGLLPGRYHLFVNSPRGWVVSTLQVGGADVLHKTFSLNSASDLAISLSRNFGAVTGIVTQGNIPRDRAMVVLVPEPIPQDAVVSSFPTAYLDENGRYEFDPVVPGRYRVIPFYSTRLNWYGDLAALREHLQGYREVIVRPNKTVSGVNFPSGK